MSTITIEFCAEDRARVDSLIDHLSGVGILLSQVVDRLGHPAPASLQEQAQACREAAAGKGLDPIEDKLRAIVAGAAPEVVAQVPDPAPAPEPAPVLAPSLEEFQKALTLRCAESDDTKAKVRALLHEYAPAASKVPEDKRAEVLERLAKL